MDEKTKGVALQVRGETPARRGLEKVNARGRGNGFIPGSARGRGRGRGNSSDQGEVHIDHRQNRENIQCQRRGCFRSMLAVLSMQM